MKNVIKTAVSVSALVLSSAAFAGGGGFVAATDDSGWYIGGNVGFGLSHWDNIDDLTFSGVSVRAGKENNFAARAKVGYDFNHHFGAEFGYTFLPYSVTLNSTGKIRNWALDLSGKMYAPVVGQFGVLATLGVNYLRSSFRNQLGTLVSSAGGTTRVSNWNVTYGAGLYYDYDATWRVTGEWQRFNGKAQIVNRKYQPFMDAFTIGISYKIPDSFLLA